jgi:hypothetical protein
LPLGPNSVFIDPHMQTPYTVQHNLTVQHALGNGLALEVGDVGSTSRKLIGAECVDPFILGTTTRVLNIQPGLQYPKAYSYSIYTDGNYERQFQLQQPSDESDKADRRLALVWPDVFTLSYTWSQNLGDTDATIFPAAVSFYNQGQFYASTNSIFGTG